MLRLVAALGFTLALLGHAAAQSASPVSPIIVAQASSCSAWNATCNARCKDDACRKSNCGAKMSACLSSGCWTEGASHGGGRHCGLQKK